jgi:hypothetical protein
MNASGESAWTYLAAWDVHRAKVFGRCEVNSAIAPVDRLVAEVMSQEPCKSTRRVFWIMDNCSAHRGQKAAKRLRDNWPTAFLIHTPVHASWLNQVEIYFSIVQRKVLTPNDFSSLADLEQRCLAFQFHYERSASPFKWTFTRRDLHALLAKIAGKTAGCRSLTEYITGIPNVSTKRKATVAALLARAKTIICARGEAPANLKHPWQRSTVTSAQVWVQR